MLKSASAVILSLVLNAAATAHEFWLSPAQYRPDNKAVLTVNLRVGMGFPGEKLPRNDQKLEQFYIIGPGGREDVKGVDGRDPAGLVRLADVGVHVLAFSSKPSFIDLEGDKFESYLKEEGLDATLADRAARKETGSVKEGYSRCAKSIICCEKPNAAEVWKKPLGLAVELIPQSDPYTLEAGAEMEFVLLVDGQPKENAFIKATNPKMKADEWITARTDSQGKVKLSLKESGAWLISTVHMNRAPEGSATNYNSIWSSLTFEIPGADTKTAKGQPITRMDEPVEPIKSEAPALPIPAPK